MSGSWDRARAMVDVTSALGDGVLLATAVTVREEISQPFDIRLSVVSARADIQPEEVLHQPMTVVLRHDGKPIRYFHGITQSWSMNGRIAGRDLTAYEARLVPRLWFLGQTADCRIFQNKSVTEIVREIMRDASIAAPDFKLQSPHKPREYITQYNETDLAFLERLLQEEGAFYFFEHKDGDHTMVVVDHNGAFTAMAGDALRFDSSSDDDGVLTGWQWPHGTTHGSMRLLDYDPVAPKKRLDAKQRTVLGAGGAATRDIVCWPALSHDPTRLRELARFRIEADEAAASLVHGKGRCRDMVPGLSFTLAENPLDHGQGEKYGIHSVQHHAWDETFLSGDAGSGYENDFTVFHMSVRWREPFSVPRPRMEGVHAAIVIGPDGTEIHRDEHDRVRVRFFWDHRKDAHADLAVWARVIYPWAGPGWGWQSTPRVGTEVAVAFMDGDPDRPVVLGGMYNGVDKPIYPEGERTKSGIRTRSSPGGGSSNFNELTFDDKKGEELIYVQAEKDMKTWVKHDQTLTVDNNRDKEVRKDETIIVGQNRTATIEQGNEKLTVSKGDMTVEISKGNLTIDAKAGKIDIKAMLSITLTVGSSSITIDQKGIALKGMLLDFKGDAMLQTSAPMTKLDAAGMMTLKAGIMMLN